MPLPSLGFALANLDMQEDLLNRNTKKVKDKGDFVLQIEEDEPSIKNAEVWDNLLQEHRHRRIL